MPEPGKLAARINWRINKPNGDFIERSVVQVGLGLGVWGSVSGALSNPPLNPLAWCRCAAFGCCLRDGAAPICAASL